MTQLIKTGNSQGVRIPRALIEQAHLENHQPVLQVVENGLLICPQKKARQGWQESIENIINSQGHELVDKEWLDAPLSQQDDWEW